MLSFFVGCAFGAVVAVMAQLLAGWSRSERRREALGKFLEKVG